jgi:cell division protein FtsN
MAAEFDNDSSAAQDLRRQVMLRLAVAAAALIAITVAMFEDITPPSTPNPSAQARQEWPAKSAARTANAPPAIAPVEGGSASRSLASAAASESGSATASQDVAPAVGASSAEQERASTQETEAGVAVAPVLAPVAPSVTKLPGGRYLQIGVFMHPANAEELKAKLLAQGLSVHTATRVQVGPFKNNEEARQVLQTLTGLGYAAVPVNQ